MPNIRQLISLKEKYSQLGSQEKLVKDYVNKELISDVAIQKGFSFTQRTMFEHFDVSNATPFLIKYFESKPTEDVVLLFIDIVDFSIITENNDNEYISNYLDAYYRKVFPIIYRYGGEIEKLMGDGIICVFGKPFINVDWPEEFNKAELCAKALIQKFTGTNKEVKVALHSGEITYYKTPGTEYTEYTMIGKPITELYRLESVSVDNAINFYAGSVYDAIKPSHIKLLSVFDRDEVTIHGFPVELNGVDYTRVRYLKFTV